jgi:uncharacterized protein
MHSFLSYEEIQKKCEQLNEKYEINQDKFFQVVEEWANKEATTEEKLIHSFQELLQVVSEEIAAMEQAVEMRPSCALGCVFCCYFPIIITKMEAKLMEKAIKQMPLDRQVKIMSHLKDYFRKYGSILEKITSIDFEEDPDFKKKYIASQVPCPLLNTETNQCLAYEIRPIPCRTYVNYANPDVCRKSHMPNEPISYEFLYNEYMGALNEFLQFLLEEEGDTAFIEYPNDLYSYDYLPNWLAKME